MELLQNLFAAAAADLTGSAGLCLRMLVACLHRRSRTGQGRGAAKSIQRKVAPGNPICLLWASTSWQLESVGTAGSDRRDPLIEQKTADRK